jgi:hypothetical protein
MDSLWGILMPYPLIAGLLLWRGWRTVPEPFLQAWAQRFAVPLDDVTRPFVAHRIGTARRIRTTAAAFTLLVPGIPLYLSAVDADDPARWNGTWLWLPFIIGAPLAVLLGEALVRQRPVRRAATLERRSIRHYVEPTPLVAVGGFAALAVLTGLVGASQGFGHHAAAAIGGGALSVALLAMGLRRIVRRPLLEPDGPLRLADDGLRADGAHHLAGAAVFLAVASLGQGFSGLADSWSSWVLLLPGLLTWVTYGYWWALTRDARWDARLARRRLAQAA